MPLNSASRVEAETSVRLEPFDGLIQRGSGSQGHAVHIVDDLGIDVGVSTGHAKTRTLGGTRDLAANTTLTTLEAFQLRLMLVHT